MNNLTYDKNGFYINGEKITIRSGAMHYFRIPKEYWYDRLLKLKECGFNALETYTAWNLHEKNEGEFDFSGNLDLAKYIELATELGLYVILRPGPYICAEWEFGGLPAWLLKYDKMSLRCNDPVFLSKVKAYYQKLLEQVRPYTSGNGGNLIMIQIENEYGSYGDDKEYLRAIADIYKEAGINCTYFTSDGASFSMLTGGTLDEYLCVANFGSKPEERFEVMKQYRPDQPLMCGEYWCGWFDHWHEQHHVRTAEEICKDFEGFFRVNASFNFYMFHGGTNFGFMNGANFFDKYEPTITSYDYCAPLNEAGDRTPTYYAVREMIKKYCGEVPNLTAKESPKAAYGKVKLTQKADLFENLERISTPIHSPTPKFMEELGQNYGYILYRSTFYGPRSERTLSLVDNHDRAHIFLNGELKGIYYRPDEPIASEDKVAFALERDESLRVDVLVENMGRVNYGINMRDRKGVSGIRLSGQFHFGWDCYCLPMEDELEKLEFSPIDEVCTESRPTFYKGELEIEGAPADTFIRLDGFNKGFVKINGFNLGRYFNQAGPQKTLYVPAPILREGKNEILVFESDSTSSLAVEFFAEPDLG